MRFPALSCGVLVLLVATASGVLALASQSDADALTIVTRSPRPIVAGENFRLPLVAQGGFAPYTWSRVDGRLPPGLKLQAHKAAISGVPTTPGEYRFNLGITDSHVPHQQVMREITITVIAGLTLDWKQPPKVEGTEVSGSAVLSNQTGYALDVTLVVVAVNSIGRATALGYQHFTLAAQAKSPVVPFGSSPGPGTYTVRADAAAHRKNGHRIFRVSKQTPDSLQITQF